jgi:hypothetical protein
MVNPPPQSPRMEIVKFLKHLGSKSFVPVGALVYTVNINSAFGYLILVNTPVFLKEPDLAIYWIM